METYEAITTRRSIGKTGEGIPKRAQIERLLECAVRAPTHHVTEPWRFVVVTGAARDELGEAWAAAEERSGGNPDKARTKIRRAPVIICVIEDPKLQQPKVVELEEHYSVGAAMQNILLAAHDAGLAAMLRTGAITAALEVREFLGVKPNEILAGFIYIGYPRLGDVRPPSRRTPAADVTDWRGWS